MANDIHPLKEGRGFPQIPIAIVSEIACTDFEFSKKLSGGKCKKHITKTPKIEVKVSCDLFLHQK